MSGSRPRSGRGSDPGVEPLAPDLAAEPDGSLSPGARDALARLEQAADADAPLCEQAALLEEVHGELRRVLDAAEPG